MALKYIQFMWVLCPKWKRKCPWEESMLKQPNEEVKKKELYFCNGYKYYMSVSYSWYMFPMTVSIVSLNNYAEWEHCGHQRGNLPQQWSCL